METKNAITPITFEDLKKFSDINTEMISEIFIKGKFFDGLDEKITKPLLQEILDEMKFALPSIAMLRQNQPTRFMMLLTEEFLRASEKIKRKNAYQLSLENIEKNIKNTREHVMNHLVLTYRTEKVLFSLLENNQLSQALTMIEAIEIERSKENLTMKVEALNWKLELMSKLGDDNGFFETLSKLLKMTDGQELKYDVQSFQIAIEFILMKKLSKGIQIQLNKYGILQFQKDRLIPQKVGEGFQELLVNKTLDAVMKTRIVESSNDLNQFLKNEWSNFVKSFRLINPYVEEILMPNFK